MKCAQCGQKPKNRCNLEGFDCTGNSLDLSGYSLEENRGFHNISEQMRGKFGNSQTRLEEIIEFVSDIAQIFVQESFARHVNPLFSPRIASYRYLIPFYIHIILSIE